jgi:hypothetical protein
MGALLQAFEIIFQVQAKRSNEKIARRKIILGEHINSLLYTLNPAQMK